MSSTDWMLTEQMVENFLHKLKLEHLRHMDEIGNDKIAVESNTLIDYATFCTAYEKMSDNFCSKCPKTFFAFGNNGVMQARYEDLSENLMRFVYTFEDYYELCYCSGEFSEHVEFDMLLNLVEQNYLEKHRSCQNMSTREFKDWSEFVEDHIRFLLNPFKRNEIFVSDVIESDILVHLRNVDMTPWLRMQTLKDFRKRFRHAAIRSEYSESNNFLVRKDFHSLNVLDDDEQQPYTIEFVNRLFDVLSTKEKSSNVADYRMDCRTFVGIRRMFFFSKSVATRQFLFEIIDLKNDGFIDIEEVRYFYNGLKRIHDEIDLAGELPFAQFEEFFISWFDQITPFNECLEKKLSFDQVKNHAYGDECLMMLVSYKALLDFDRRFELGSDNDLAADTIVGENDENHNPLNEEEKCRELISEIFE